MAKGTSASHVGQRQKWCCCCVHSSHVAMVVEGELEESCAVLGKRQKSHLPKGTGRACVNMARIKCTTVRHAPPVRRGGGRCVRFAMRGLGRHILTHERAEGD